MSNYDFLLKLPNKGFLGLTCTGEKTDGLPIVEAPDADNIIGVPLLKTSVPDVSNAQSDLKSLRSDLKSLRKEKSNLYKERTRLYGLTQTLINLKSANKEKNNQDLESFSLVVTKEIKEEAVVALKTLRLFNNQPAYIISDEESSNFIKKFNITNLNFKNYLNENYREKIKKRFFNERFKDLHTFHKVECIFPKMDAMNFALKENSNTLFIDADLVFCEEVEIESDKEIILGPHYNPARRFFQNFNNGFFNAGYVFCANKSFPRYWRRIYLTDSRFYEQQGMDYIYEKYDIDILDKRHNLGWWRNQEDDFDKELILEDVKGIISFHIHLNDNYDFGDNDIVRRKNKQFKDILYNYCKSNNKEEVIKIIEEVLPKI